MSIPTDAQTHVTLPPSIGLNTATVWPIDEYMSQSKIVGNLQVQSHDPEAAILARIDTRAPGYVTLIQGALSTTALGQLVRRCGADRKLLQSNFHSSAGFPLWTLPSRPKPFAAVRFITLGSFAQGEPVTINSALRSRIADNLRIDQDAYLTGDRDGHNCFRAINLLDKSFFTVEQQATFFTYVNDTDADTGPGGLWSGVLLSDVGRHTRFRPWLTTRRGFRDAWFLTVGSSDLGSARSAKIPESVAYPSSSTGDAFLPYPNPFMSRDIDDVAMPLDDQQRCAREPFIFAADLFETSALCWDQALNFLRDTSQSLPDEPAARVRVLKETKELVDRAARYFDETLRFIDARAEMGWPDRSPRPGEIAARLTRDFSALRHTAAGLSAFCQETVSITMNEISVRAAQQALEEGKRVQVVTYLAFFFIPISLVGTIFGMNVAELENPPPISLFFYICAGIAPLCIIVPIWLEFRGRVTWKRILWSILPNRVIRVIELVNVLRDR